MWRNRDESRSLLFGRFGETFVELGDVMIFEKAVGLFFGFDSVKFKFVWQPALKSGIHPFASATCLRRVSGDHADPKFV